MIKRITRQDEINQLVNLFERYRIFYKREPNADKAKEFLQERINNEESVVYVCMDDTRSFTGFTQLYPLFSSTKMERLWLLNDLFVDENHRKKGYATALINAAKEHCKKTDYCGLLLETEKNNNKANSLYLKSKFELEKGTNYYFWDENKP